MQRILFLITSTGTGGTESMLRELVLRLDRSQFKPFVCSLLPPGRTAEEIEASGTRVSSLGLSERPGLIDLARGARRLAKQIDEDSVDLVQSFLYRANFIAPLSARLSSRRPVVVTGHRSLAPVEGYYAVLSARLAQQLADRCVANTGAVQEYLVRNEGGRYEKISVIPNGVDTAKFRSRDRTAARARLGIDSHTLAVGAAGRLEPVKGFRHLLQAAAELSDHDPPIRFLLAGDGSERSRLEGLVRELGLQSRVSFLGVQHDMAALYAALDIFVLPSLREGFPNVVLEAMASGCTVLATRVGGVSEIIEDDRSGIIVMPAMPAQLAKALRRLAGDSELRNRLSATARRRVEERFQVGHMVRAFEQLYTGLLEAQGTGRRSLRDPAELETIPTDSRFHK